MNTPKLAPSNQLKTSLLYGLLLERKSLGFDSGSAVHAQADSVWLFPLFPDHLLLCLD
jgi:hypothetical protein